jgi:hypothetical protein
MYGFTLIKMTVSPFVGTGRFLIFQRSYEINILTIKEVPGLFKKKHYSFNLKIGKIQSSHYRNISTDPPATGHGSLGIRGPHFENHCFREYW